MAVSGFNLKKISLAWRLFKHAYAGYRWQIIFITALGFVSGLLGGLGIGMLIPLFAFATKQANVPVPNTFQHFIKQVLGFFHLGFNLPLILLLLVALFIGKAVISIVVTYINEKISARYLKDTGASLFSQTLRADWPFLMNQKVGHLDRIISGDASCGAAILRTVSEIMLRLTGLLTYAFIAFKISAAITLLSLACGAVMLLLFKPFFYRQRALGKAQGELGRTVSHHINESLIGIKTIKAFGREVPVAAVGTRLFETLRQLQVKAMVLSGVQGTLFEPASLILISLLFVYSYRIPHFDIASFAVIIYLIQKMFSFIQGIQAKLDNINSAFPRLHSMLAYQAALQNQQEPAPGQAAFRFEQKLALQGVSFSYAGTASPVLRQVSFEVQKGEMLGIIGPSGAGKTTLVDLLLRLLTPQSGSIQLDGVASAEIALADWRRQIGYVAQEVFLLNDTIEQNIRFYDPTISRAAVERAAQLANIADFIKTLPQQWQTSVGERGVRLSGGQKQRIALARVLAKQPTLLILDEATSALDNESEAAIQTAIAGLKGKITVLVIAHRLSTVMGADRLIVLKSGRIVESGPPTKLLARSDSYLYQSYHAA